jgi:hypothetical protein
MAIFIGHPPYPHRGGELEPVKPHILVMCGRYASFFPAEALAQLFGTVNPLLNLETTWNMAPSGDASSAGLSRWRAPSRRAEVGSHSLLQQGPEAANAMPVIIDLNSSPVTPWTREGR